MCVFFFFFWGGGSGISLFSGKRDLRRCSPIRCDLQSSGHFCYFTMPPLRRSNCLSIIVVVVATFCVGAGAQLLPSSTASSATGDITGVHDSSNSTSTSQTECEYQGTVPPASGKCRGPGERAEVRLAAAEEITGCPQNQVPYYVDGVKTKLKVLLFFFFSSLILLERSF